MVKEKEKRKATKKHTKTLPMLDASNVSNADDELEKLQKLTCIQHSSNTARKQSLEQTQTSKRRRDTCEGNATEQSHLDNTCEEEEEEYLNSKKSNSRLYDCKDKKNANTDSIDKDGQPFSHNERSNVHEQEKNVLIGRENDSVCTISDDDEELEYESNNDDIVDDEDDGYAQLCNEEAEILNQKMKCVELNEKGTLDSEAKVFNSCEGGDDNEDDDDEDDSNLIVWRRDQDETFREFDYSKADADVEDVTKKLTYSNKAYDSFFQLRTEYPCLSFDIICNYLSNSDTNANKSMRNYRINSSNESDYADGSDGCKSQNYSSRSAITKSNYPLSMTLICGTQANEMNKNELIVLHVSNICRTKHDVESDDDSDDSYIGDDVESDDDADNDDDDDGDGIKQSDNIDSNADANHEVNDGEPLIQHRTIAHYGTANRVRCCPQMKNASKMISEYAQLVAVWSDAGHVQIFDLDDNVRALTDFANWSKEKAQMQRLKHDSNGKLIPKKSSIDLKFCTPSSSHKTEGYGIDWSPVKHGVFASGDCNGELYLWQPTSDGRWMSSGSNTTSANSNTLCSIEEIQWSPTQSEVLITARAGGVVEVWDARDMRQSKLHWSADASDINVADWNKSRQASHLLVTGAESGAVAVWDLRKLSSASPIQHLPWHTKSITSVEFSKHNESVLSVTSDDGQCTLWDLSLERDLTQEQEVIGKAFGRADLSNIPDQLMFQHQGLVHPKEAHWHPEIPGMVITTDYEGLHLFRPMNWRSLMK